MDFRWPKSKSEIERIHRVRKRVAVERAMRSPFLRKRMPKLDLERLDNPEVWRKIPVLTKEDLRQIPPQRFHDEFCIQPRTRVVEYWRSGGATGRPLFYPRSAEDMQHNLLIFERAWALIGATADDCAHISFPLGVHPVAHLYARAAINLGITEGALVSGEALGHHGLHAFADMYFLEVIDDKTGAPVADGEVGSLIVTPLWSNSMTPFLRWSSGDLVSLSSQGAGEGPWSVYPVMRHARRTVGFFKVRGVNINHSDLEDAMFRDPEVVDFRAELLNEGNNDVLHLHVEMRAQARERVIDAIKKTFQVTPRVTLLERGTIAREFEANIKAPRFVDKRG